MPIQKAEAKQLLSEFRRGTLGGHPLAARELLVGREFWMQGVREELEEARDYGTGPVRFVIGSYGDGKRHFLQAVVGEALERRFWCSYCSLEREAALKKLELEVLWKRLVRELYVPGVVGRESLPKVLEHLVREKGADQVREAARAANVEPDLERGLVGYAERTAAGQDAGDVRYWLLGEAVRPPGIKTKIDAKNAMAMVSSLVRFVRELGDAGIVVALDELELAKDGTQAERRRFYESLRQLVDRQIPGYVVYGAATPDTLSDPKGFQEHQPLWDRVRVYADQSSKKDPSPKQPVIYLDAVPLGEPELVEIGRRIREIHALGEDWNAANGCTDEALAAVAGEVARSSVGVGRPRLFVTTVIRDLDRKLHDPRFDPLADVRRRVVEGLTEVTEAERRRHGVAM